MMAALYPYLWVVVAKYSLRFSLEKNLNPREHLAGATGVGARANWAQKNSWEAFGPFAAAVVASMQVGVDETVVGCYSLCFVVSRFFYGLCYLMNWGVLRSLVWFVGFAAVIGLFFQVIIV